MLYLSRYKYLKKITMKLIKGLLVIAVLSLIIVSCNETKKDIQKDSQENVELVKDAENSTEEEAGKTAEVVEVDAGKVLDSTKAMADGETKKCEGKCSEDGKSCDGSCKA